MREEIEFEGGVFSDTIEGGRAGARVLLRREGVVAIVPDGREFLVSYAECQLERGGASGQMWFCRTRDRGLTIFCEARGFDEALRVHGQRELGPALDQMRAQSRLGDQRALRMWGIAIVATLVLLVGGYFGIRQAGRAAIDLLPHSADEQVGKLAMGAMNLEGEVVTDPLLKSAVRSIVDRLSKSDTDGFRFDVRIVDASIVNAFALPGGQIVVYTGLLRAAKTPEQVAGVLAHEMAHVTRRHGMQRIAQSVGVIALVQLLAGDVSGLAAVGVELVRDGAINSYSREQESDADTDGVERMRGARLDPRALAEFFEVLKSRELGLPSMAAWLGTHPDLAERIANVRKQSVHFDTRRARAFEFNWAEVQRHAGALADTTPKIAAEPVKVEKP